MQNLETFVLHPLIFAGTIFGIIVWILWGLNHKNRIGYILSPILYLLHLLSFFILANTDIIPRNIYAIWSDLVFIHSLIVIVSAALVMLHIMKEVK